MTEFKKTHVLFLVDATWEQTSDTISFIKEVRAGKEYAYSYDVVTFSTKTRNRVINGEGKMNYRRTQNQRRALYKSLSEEIDRLGSRLEKSEHKPEHVMVVLLVGGMDNVGDVKLRSELVDKISRQYWVYKWKFMVVGDGASAVGEDLELYEYMSLDTKKINDEYSILETRRVIYDMSNYGDCGW